MPFMTLLFAATLTARAPVDRLFGETVFRFDAPHAIEQIVLSPDGRRVAYAHFEATDEGTYVLEVRRLAGGPPLRLVPHARYAPCVCDGGIGRIRWIDNRRLRVDAGFDDDGHDGELHVVFDAWTGRLLSMRSIRFAASGPRSVSPEDRPSFSKVARAFATVGPGRGLEGLFAGGFRADAGTHVVKVSSEPDVPSGLWAVDLATSRRRLLLPLADDLALELGGGVRIGSAMVVLFGSDPYALYAVEDGRMRSLASVPQPESGIRALVPVRTGRRRALFLVESQANVAGSVEPGTLYDSDGRTARRIEAYPDVYAASTDARGRLIAISTGETAVVRRLASLD